MDHAPWDDVVEEGRDEETVVQHVVGRPHGKLHPARPATTKMIRKPSTHIMGTSKRITPRYRVKTQLRILSPDGGQRISVERPREGIGAGSRHPGRAWSSPGAARRVTPQMAPTMAV